MHILCIQDFDLMNMQANNRTPLQRAVERRATAIVYYFVKECNVDISTLDKVIDN